MSFLKKIFSRPDNSNPKKSLDIDSLLQASDLNKSIIAIDNYLCKLEKLTPEQENFYYIQELEREVNNGGFHQYFSNSSGDFAHETLLSLNEIGAVKTAGILQAAIDQFPESHVPKDRDKRQDVLAEIEDAAEEKFNELTEAFFRYDDDLNGLNIAYVKKNKDKF